MNKKNLLHGIPIFIAFIINIYLLYIYNFQNKYTIGYEYKTPKSQEFMAEIDKRYDDYNFTNKKDEEEGYYRIDEINIENMTENYFYTNYVSKNIPVIIKNLTRKWPAYEKFRNDSFLLEKIGDLIIKSEKKPRHDKNFAYFINQFKRQKIKYREFLDLYMKYETEPYIYYWAEQEVPSVLKKEIIEPEFASFMNLENTNIWQVKLSSFLFSNKLFSLIN